MSFKPDDGLDELGDLFGSQNVVVSNDGSIYWVKSSALAHLKLPETTDNATTVRGNFKHFLGLKLIPPLGQHRDKIFGISRSVAEKPETIRKLATIEFSHLNPELQARPAAPIVPATLPTADPLEELQRIFKTTEITERSTKSRKMYVIPIEAFPPATNPSALTTALRHALPGKDFSSVSLVRDETTDNVSAIAISNAVIQKLNKEHLLDSIAPDAIAEAMECHFNMTGRLAQKTWADIARGHNFEGRER